MEPHEPKSGQENDEDLQTIVGEEERVLTRIQKHLETRDMRRDNGGLDYDAELIALRDQIAEARIEDVPPLIEEMERLQMVAQRRAQVTEGAVDPLSPYFGRLVLQEGERKREVLIGRGTYVDPRTGIRIVDWREAPVSRLYYRYDEGDDYEETFGGRDVQGEVLTRRSLAIVGGKLRRIGSPQGTFIRSNDGWRRADASATHLKGGQGAAMRPEGHHKPGKLGAGVDDGREDRFLPEITALIDPQQFDLITRPNSGLVVIQGGAGSGKTTIGLHRMAYLAFQDPKRFRADRMLIVVFNDALARYISRVLPALGVDGVPVTTFHSWIQKQRRSHVPGLTAKYTDETPSVVTRFKKHPALLRMIDDLAATTVAKFEREVKALLEAHGESPLAHRLQTNWRKTEGLPLGVRVDAVAKTQISADEKVPVALRHGLDRIVSSGRAAARDVIGAWHELLTDKTALAAGLEKYAPGTFEERELAQVVHWCSARCSLAIAEAEERAHARQHAGDEDDSSKRRMGGRDLENEMASDLDLEGAMRDAHRSHRSDDSEDDRSAGVDGTSERSPAELDLEDDTLLLRLVQVLKGPLSRGKEPLSYGHMFIDETQDLSPVELAVVLGTAANAAEGPSVTLAGDTAQRLLMDNGFSDWKGVLHDLGLDHVAVEPLKVTYRSTAEIVEFATEVLGPLAPAEKPQTIRHGTPVELFRFAHSGEAVGFVGEALRELLQTEPRASVAVIARYPEQADLYYRGFITAEVPNLRRISAQDFPFKAGVDVTDVRQVKGLEFDYVVLVEVSTASYPTDDEARHLLHIAATRAAHQLWITTTGTPSKLLPESLRDRGY